MVVSQDAPATKLVLGPENEHFWLVQRMAKATGIDLVKAADVDLMTQKDWADIVTHCRGCNWSDGCGRWLDKPREGLRDLPQPCVNRTRLAEIKADLEELMP